jgi:hypothetical protein
MVACPHTFWQNITRVGVCGRGGSLPHDRHEAENVRKG